MRNLRNLRNTPGAGQILTASHGHTPAPIFANVFLVLGGRGSKMPGCYSIHILDTLTQREFDPIQERIQMGGGSILTSCPAETAAINAQKTRHEFSIVKKQP